jgi:hypothetical protein
MGIMTSAYVNVACCTCGMPIWITDEYKAWLRADARRLFYCPAGHSQHFSADDNDIDKMRRERDLVKQQLAQKDDTIAYQRAMREAAEKSASSRKGVITRLKNRAAAGVCPCCNRTVSQMARHIASKHPTFKVEEVA